MGPWLLQYVFLPIAIVGAVAYAVLRRRRSTDLKLDQPDDETCKICGRDL